MVLRSRWALLSLITVLYWVTNQGLRPYLPIRLQELGASELVIGLSVAGYSVSGLLLAVPAGRFVDKARQHRLLLGALAALAVSTAVLALTKSVAVLALLMFANGLFAMGVWLVLQSMITFAGTGDERRRQLSLFSLAWGVGLAAGPALGAVLYDVFGFTATVVTFSVVAVAGGVTAIAVPAVEPGKAVDEEDDEVREDLSLFTAVRRSMDNPVLVAVLFSSFINVFVLSIRMSFYPLYLEQAGLTLSRIGILLSLIGATSLVIRAILPPLTGRFGMFRILLWSTVAAVVGAAATPLFAHVWALAILGAVLIGVGLGANPPITVNLVAEHSDSRERGLSVGLRMMANRSAQVSQPLLFGGLAALAGLAAAFPVAGVALGAMTVWMATQLRRLRK